MMASQAVGLVSAPRPMRVASLATTMPALRKPRKARNAPMPAVIANFRPSGIARTMACRAPITLRITNSAPEMKTAPRAVCQGYPMAPTTVKAKKAFSPMPGAWANG